MLLCATGHAIANTEMGTQDYSAPGSPLLEKRQGCSGQRVPADRCTGKRLAPQNSFSNW